MTAIARVLDSAATPYSLDPPADAGPAECWRCCRKRTLNRADLCDDCTVELRAEGPGPPPPKVLREAGWLIR